MKQLTSQFLRFILSRTSHILQDIGSLCLVILARLARLSLKLIINALIIILPIATVSHLYQPLERIAVNEASDFKTSVIDNLARQHGYLPPVIEPPFSIKRKLLQEMKVNKVPLQLYPILRGLVRRESKDNQFAVSTAKAKGYMQLMPDTAAQCGITDPFDRNQNIQCGVWWFKKMLVSQNFKVAQALREYNAGISRMGKSAENRSYVDDVLNATLELEVEELQID